MREQPDSIDTLLLRGKETVEDIQSLLDEINLLTQIILEENRKYPTNALPRKKPTQTDITKNTLLRIALYEDPGKKSLEYIALLLRNLKERATSFRNKSKTLEESPTQQNRVATQHIATYLSELILTLEGWEKITLGSDQSLLQANNTLEELLQLSSHIDSLMSVLIKDNMTFRKEQQQFQIYPNDIAASRAITELTLSYFSYIHYLNSLTQEFLKDIRREK